MLLIVVIFFSLFNEKRQAPVYGFFCGLFEDLYMGRFIGLNAIAKSLTAFLLSHLQGLVFKENVLVGMIAALAGTMVNALFMLLLSLFKYQAIHWDYSILLTILFQSLYNTLLSAPFYIWYYNSARYGALRNTGER